MKILGIGVDIICNKRIKTSIKKKKFIERIFGKNEIANAKNLSNKTNYFAKRFAAKEAFVKAIGTGFSNNLNFKDIEILNDKIGKPYYLMSKKMIKVIYRKFNTKKLDLFLSISDEKDYSVAFSILHKKHD